MTGNPVKIVRIFIDINHMMLYTNESFFELWNQVVYHHPAVGRYLEIITTFASPHPSIQRIRMPTYF